MNEFTINHRYGNHGYANYVIKEVASDCNKTNSVKLKAPGAE